VVHFRTSKALIGTVVAATIASVSAAGLATDVAGASVATAGSTNSTITIGAPSGAQGLDPYNCANGPEFNILLSGYDTLIRSAPDGSFQPSLATAFKYTSPTTFSLTLRSGVTFTDGTPLDANVVAANLNRAAKTFTEITAPLALAMKSATVVSPTQLTIELNTPNPDLTTILSSCAGMIVSPKLLASPNDMATTMDGTGPYTYDTNNSISG
jgi:peptide/nickel transport system substrate-binding protein